MIRPLFVGMSLAAALALAACGQKPAPTEVPKEIVFSILSAENQASSGPLWQPLLDDMSAQVGVKVKPYFATNYTSLIEAMRFNQVQVGWFSALPSLEAINRADGEVLGRIVNTGGSDTSTSVLIVKKGSGITLDKVLACGKRYNFGLGDPKSTTGTLAPMAYLFTPKGIEPSSCFKTVRQASHQSNEFSIANGVLDVATNNSIGLVFFARAQPELSKKVEVIWTSVPIPESSIVARKDLDPALKEKVRQFFLTYGTGTGPAADKQREVLKKLDYAGFKPADNTYLDPVREMVAGQDLADAKKSGDAAKIAKAQAEFDKIHNAAAQKRAVEPDV